MRVQLSHHQPNLGDLPIAPLAQVAHDRGESLPGPSVTRTSRQPANGSKAKNRLAHLTRRNALPLAKVRTVSQDTVST